MKSINISEWIEENRKYFQPPICNKLMYNDQLKVFFVGGPNQRQDYHLELGEEFFYMLKGDMELKIWEQGKPHTISIKEGEIFLLPGRIPHSPQRKANTIGLVIERRREPNELDGLRYYVNNNNNDNSKDNSGTMNNNNNIDNNNNEDDNNNNDDRILYERWFYCKDLGTQLAPIINSYYKSEEYRLGRPTENSKIIEAPYPDDRKTKMIEPMNLTKLLNYFAEEIDQIGFKDLFKDFQKQNFKTKVWIFGGNFKHSISKQQQSNENTSDYDTFLWQLNGTAIVHYGNDSNHNQISEQLKIGHCLNIHSENYPIWLETKSGCFTLVLQMPPPSF